MIRRLPFQHRLALAYSSFFTLILVVLCVGVYLGVRQALIHELSEQLMVSSNLIEQEFVRSDEEFNTYFSAPAFPDASRLMQMTSFDAPMLFVQVNTLAGTAISHSESLGNLELALPPSSIQKTLAGQSDYSVSQLGETRLLVYSRPLRDEHGIVGILVVGHSLRELNRTLQLLLISLLVTGGVALAATVRAGIWLTSRALEPVADISRTARQIVGADDLARRVPEVLSHDPIGELSTTTNTMLARLEQLFTAQQRFVADVSHELRTPLTAMRGQIEVLRRGAARDPHILDASLADLDHEATRLTRLANDLLTLAEAESGAALLRTTVSLDELVLDVVREMQPLAHDISLIPDISEQIELQGDRDRLKQALLNLVSNALQHTPAGGVVRVILDRTPVAARISVADTGSGIAPDDLPHVFERFYRADKARTRASGGAGLGLAIVQWVATAHGGAVAVDSTPGHGSTFTLSLPI